MNNYIHNGHNGETASANLRVDLDKSPIHRTRLSSTTSFYVIVFEDKAGCTWDDEWTYRKAYCGIIEYPDHQESFENGVRQIMQTGGKPYDLADFLVAQKLHSS
jgi:hypothetical protein